MSDCIRTLPTNRDAVAEQASPIGHLMREDEQECNSQMSKIGVSGEHSYVHVIDQDTRQVEGRKDGSVLKHVDREVSHGIVIQVPAKEECAKGSA